MDNAIDEVVWVFEVSDEKIVSGCFNNWFDRVIVEDDDIRSRTVGLFYLR